MGQSKRGFDTQSGRDQYGLRGRGPSDRRTIAGKLLKEGPVQEITISTRVPGKWRFVDLETGRAWSWDGRFREVGQIQGDDATFAAAAINPS